MTVEEQVLAVLEEHNRYRVWFVSREGCYVRERWMCLGCEQVFLDEGGKEWHKVEKLAEAGLLRSDT